MEKRAKRTWANPATVQITGVLTLDGWTRKSEERNRGCSCQDAFQRRGGKLTLQHRDAAGSQVSVSLFDGEADEQEDRDLNQPPLRQVRRGRATSRLDSISGD